MSLIVEDGSGKSDSNSYISLADATTYAALISTTWSAAETSDKEDALQLATQYIDLQYGALFNGQQAVIGQALEWPRNYVYDRSGVSVSASSVPDNIKKAVVEIAVSIIDGNSVLAPSDDLSTIDSESISIGPLSISQSFSGGKASIKRYPKVEKLVSKFLGSSTIERA